MSWLTRFSDDDVLREAIRRKQGTKLLRDTLFDKQKEFNRDKARFKAALNTRRSGKSYLAAVRLLEAAQNHPGSVNPYIALTRDSAKRILWPTLTQIIRECQVPIKGEPKESSLTIELENNSQVFLVGADQSNFINRLRGIKCARAAIDEAQGFHEHIETLVDDVLTPALADYNGDLDIYGTPGIRPSGFFFDITTGRKEGFSVHRWGVLDNPYLPDAHRFIAEMKQRRGWTEDNPTYRREWLGQWVLDLDALLFRFKDSNIQAKPQDLKLDCIMGIDFGFRDKTAWVVIHGSTEHPNAYVTFTEAQSELIPSQIALRTAQLIERFKPISIVTDEGGLGKSIAEEMRRRYGLPVKPANKSKKILKISLINGDFIDQRLFVDPDCIELIEQLKNTPKSDDGIEDPQVPFDLCDALIYAHFEAKNYAFAPKNGRPDLYSEDYIEQALEKEAMRRQNQNWWETWEN